MNDDSKCSNDMQRYMAAAHAMQSGVAMMLNYDRSDSISTKHLRVGVNSGMVQNGALVALLIAKGVFTSDEWMTALADAMEREVRSYEDAISARVGSKVTLK